MGQVLREARIAVRFWIETPCRGMRSGFLWWAGQEAPLYAYSYVPCRANWELSGICRDWKRWRRLVCGMPECLLRLCFSGARVVEDVMPNLTHCGQSGRMIMTTFQRANWTMGVAGRAGPCGHGRVKDNLCVAVSSIHGSLGLYAAPVFQQVLEFESKFLAATSQWPWDLEL